MLKDKKKLTILIVAIIIIILAIFLIIRSSKSDVRTSVAEEYKYNTVIISNDNAPKEGQPQLDSINGYVEDKEQKLATLPYAIEKTENGETTTVLEVVSIGKYTGAYTLNNKNEQVEDIFAMVVNNPTDKVLSIASIDITYAKDLVSSINPSNIPPHQSTLVFFSSQPIAYADVTEFECSVDYAVQSDKLPLLEGKVGVDYKDGNLIITNLTSEFLGDVYVRYQNIAGGNTYLGGNTYSAYAANVQPYETYLIPAPDFNKENSVIISVESVITQQN